MQKDHEKMLIAPDAKSGVVVVSLHSLPLAILLLLHKDSDHVFNLDSSPIDPGQVLAS